MRNQEKKATTANVVPQALQPLLLEPLTQAEVYGLTNLFTEEERHRRQTSLTQVLLYLVDSEEFELVREHVHPITEEISLLLDWDQGE